MSVDGIDREGNEIEPMNYYVEEKNKEDEFKEVEFEEDEDESK